MVNYTTSEFGGQVLTDRNDIRRSSRRMDLEQLDTSHDGRYLRTLARQRGDMAKRMSRLWGAL